MRRSNEDANSSTGNCRLWVVHVDRMSNACLTSAIVASLRLIGTMLIASLHSKLNSTIKAIISVNQGHNSSTLEAKLRHKRHGKVQ